MTRKGLLIALAIGLVLGAVFAIFPGLDLTVSRLMYDHLNPGFERGALLDALRKGSEWIGYLIIAPAVLAVLVKFFLPHLPMFVPGRAALFLIASLIIGPGIVTNAILKDHWGRYRPVQVTEFGGKNNFTAWWDPSGSCRRNCSFVAGEPSSAFWTTAPASLAPPQWQPLAYGAAITFGVFNGLLRLAYGGHFFSDVVFAGVFTFVIVWLTHGFIYRWPRTRLSDETIERAIGWPMTRLYGLSDEGDKRRAD